MNGAELRTTGCIPRPAAGSSSPPRTLTTTRPTIPKATWPHSARRRYGRACPLGWAAWQAKHGRFPRYRLTGALPHSALRHDKSGVLAQLIAACEEAVWQRLQQGIPEAGQSAAGNHGRPHDNPSLHVAIVPCRLSLRYGQPQGKRQNQKTLVRQPTQNRPANSGLTTKLETRGYLLPNEGRTLRSEAIAGDTIEIVTLQKGVAKRPGLISFRASARWVEAQRIIESRRIDNAFTPKRLEDLFDHRLVLQPHIDKIGFLRR